MKTLTFNSSLLDDITKELDTLIKKGTVSEVVSFTLSSVVDHNGYGYRHFAILIYK